MVCRAGASVSGITGEKGYIHYGVRTGVRAEVSLRCAGWGVTMVCRLGRHYGVRAGVSLWYAG